MITIGPRLLEQLDIPSAVDAEAVWDPDILPLPIMNIFAESESESVANYVAEVSQAGLAVTTAPMISASKWRFGRRPVALFPFVERVLYRAIVKNLQPEIGELDRSPDAYQRFVRAPLDHTSCNYVIVTDIANFYSSIPTQRLARELVERTGRWEPVEWLRKFWLALAGGYNGIPQVSEPSHLVADIYADEIHRRLARQGILAWRYSDDFRIAASTAAECVQILDIFDEEVTSLGLFVNERKTYTPSRTRYEEMVTAQSRIWNKISEEVRADLTEFDLYSQISIEPEAAEVLQSAMVRVLEYWESESGSQKHDIGTEIELSKLVRAAINILSVVNDSSGLPFCKQLLVDEPQLTPDIANYMRTLKDIDGVPKELSKIVDAISLTRWQTLWLAFVCETQPYAGAWGKRVNAWLTECATNPSEYVRSQAAWSMALTRSLNLNTWNRLQATSTRLGAPYVAASLAGVIEDAPQQKAVLLSADQLDRKVYNWAGLKCRSF